MLRPEKAESQVFKKQQAQNINFSSSHIIAQLMKTNIGPNGSTKLLENSDGTLSLTKDGGNLIKQLTIINPTALFIARAAMSQEKMFHDGVSTIVTLIDSILTQSEYIVNEGIHPRIISNGLLEARDAILTFLDTLSIETPTDRSSLRDIANSASLTKCPQIVSDILVDAILCTREKKTLKTTRENFKTGEKNETTRTFFDVDLDRIEVLKVKSQQKDVRLIKGIVLDQGFRHENMPKNMKDVRILLLNVSLVLEDTAVSTYMPVANADQRERLTIASRKFVENKVKAIIELRDAIKSDFLLVNGKGIDGPSLDILSRANISALRNVSQKNINRLMHATGARVVNCIDDLTPQDLGFAGHVFEETFRGEKTVYVDEVKDPKAVAIVIRGLDDTYSGLVESAVFDGLRALKHAMFDGKILPGAGATEIAINVFLEEYKKKVDPKFRIGINVMQEAILAIPRCLAENSGLDVAEVIVDMQKEAEGGELGGIDLDTGEVIDPTLFGIFDNYCVKRGILQSAPIVATQLLLVDQIIQSGKAKPNEKEEPPKE